MIKVPMTETGFTRMQEELRRLKGTDRPAVIRAIADRVYVMQQGRIVEEGPTEAVFTAPRNAYTRALLAATPKLPVYA